MSSNQFHDQMSGLDNHPVHSFTYADEATRLAATGFAAEEIGRVALQEDDGTFWILSNNSPVAWKELTHHGVDTDESVKVSATDTTEGKLVDKLEQSGLVQLSVENQGGNERLKVHVTNMNTDRAVAVTANDTVPSNLAGKIQVGDGIALEVVNAGGNEQLRISTTGGGVDSDENVKASATDTTAAKLIDKLVQGANIIITKQNEGGNETLRIAADVSGVGGNPERFMRIRQTEWDNPSGRDRDRDNGGDKDWPVTKLARLRRDPIKNAIRIREFDDSRSEGLGFFVRVPDNITNITLRVKGRAQSDPGVTKKVALALYWRRIPDDGPTDDWGVKQVWDNFIQMDDADWHYNETTHTIATEGIYAGFYQFELIRDTDSANDTLSGNWLMVDTELEFS